MLKIFIEFQKRWRKVEGVCQAAWEGRSLFFWVIFKGLCHFGIVSYEVIRWWINGNTTLDILTLKPACPPQPWRRRRENYFGISLGSVIFSGSSISTRFSFLIERLGDHRVNLAGYDGWSRLHGRQIDLVHSAARAGRHPAQIVADFGYLNRSPFHCGGH